MSIVAAYVVPHPPLAVPAVGRGQERAVQDTLDAYREVARRVAAHAPDTIVVSSPHAPAFRDCFHVSTVYAAHGDMRSFGAVEEAMNVPYDSEFAAAVSACARKHAVPICGSGMHDGDLDHGTFVPLHFVNQLYGGYRLVRIGLSGLSAADHRAVGRCVAEAARDLGRTCVFLASGDLSHKLLAEGPYGYAAEGPVFDHDLVALLDAGDLEGLFRFDEAFLQAAAECGLGSFQIMAGVLEGVPFTHELLSYEGPFGVGYAVAAFEVEGEEGDAAVASGVDREQDVDEAQDDLAAFELGADPYVALARASVEGFVRTGRTIERPAGLPPELVQARAGVSSLHEDGELRGCIGTISPVTGSVADEIVRNGVAAASEAHASRRCARTSWTRWLTRWTCCSRPSPSTRRRSWTLYATASSWPRGTAAAFCCRTWKGVDTVEQQLAIAKRKAGIDPADDDVRLERFEVVRHDRGGGARRG